MRFRLVFWAMVVAIFASSCASRDESYSPKAYLWNQNEDQFVAMISAAENKALSGDQTALRDLIIMSHYTDGGPSEIIGESLANVWDKRGQNGFFGGVKYVPECILDDLPGFIEVARDEVEAEKMRKAVEQQKTSPEQAETYGWGSR